jgi:hypothetical protein
MLNRGTSLGSDSESLQTDVMRFLAIIAFCLIAVLALVRSAPAPVAEATPEPAAAEPDISAPEPTPATPATDSRQTAPVARRVAVHENRANAATPEPNVPAVEPPALAPAPAAQRLPSTTVATTAATPAPELMSEPEPEQSPTRPLRSPPVASAPAAQEPEQEGLTLRFASDSDFLRLVARGEIVVYAFSGTDVLRLDGSYRFSEAPAPGQVYELLPGSVPSLISDALRDARQDGAGFRWGIALPGRMRQRIEQLVNRVDRGQLVIDRYGDVHHVAAS